MTSWSTVAVLLVITWVDGLRRVGPGMLVLNWTLTNAWRPIQRRVGAGWHLVALWPPIEVPLVLPETWEDNILPPSTAEARFGRRLDRLTRLLALVRGLSVVLLFGIVLGIPYASGRYGAFGLLVGLAAVLLLACVLAALVYVTLRRGGLKRNRALRRSAGLISPFHALGASEVVLTEIARGTPRLLVAKRLLSDEQFGRYVRRQAWDALIGCRGESADGDGEVMRLLGERYLRAAVARVPRDCRDGDRYCPRCASLYTAMTWQCAECEGVAVLSSKPAVGAADIAGGHYATKQ